MNKKKFSAYVAIYFSLLAAVILMVLPLPPSLLWFRPHWLTLTLIYWLVFAPNYIGVVAAFCFGVLLDLIGGVLLGSTGLVLAIVTFLTITFGSRIRLMKFWQQLLVIICLVGFEQLIYLWLQLLLGRTFVVTRYWLATSLNIIAWPMLFLLLRSYQRKLRLL